MNDAALTHDAFLGGRLHLWQPKSGYRAGVDPVLLAATVKAEAGQSVLDAGCGVGAAGLCLAERIEGVRVRGLELQSDYAALARRNAAEAALDFEVFEGNLKDPPDAIKQMSFDHVITNPPYFERKHRTRAQDDGRDQALVWQVSPRDWIKLCLKRLKPGGWLHVIHRAEALAHLLSDVPDNLGHIDIFPISARAGRPAQLILFRGRKDARRPLHLHAPIVMHDGPRHLRDGDDYTPEISAVLRKGAALHLDKG